MYIATLQALGLAPHLITQNVDNLHRKALAKVLGASGGGTGVLSQASVGTVSTQMPLAASGVPFCSSSGSGTKARALTGVAPRILELHGTLARVHCIQHMHEQTRDAWQEQLAGVNPRWDEQAYEMEVTGR
jgi:NAD-dependent SIR2 family protein deacetylase